MAKKLGIIKSISGSAEVIAVDKSGNQRVLKVGDSLYEGETVKTTSADSKVVIATNNGKELSMIGEDTLSLDPKATAADSQVAALQKALLNGANLEDLEETAAGGNSGGRGDGMSLGETRFEHGGHYSNISASTSAINPLGAASFAGPVEGKSGGLDSGRDGSDDYTAGTGTTIDPETTRKPSNPEIKFPEDTNKDGKISDDENKAGDKDTGKTTVEVTIPKDGSVKPGDKVVVTDDNGKKTEKPINQDDIDKGKIDIPVDLNPGKDNNVTAEIINPNNPNNPGKDSKVIGEDSENTKTPEAPVITEVIDDVKGYGEDTKVGNVLDVKGHLTNDKTPTIKGTAKAGSKVEIYDNGDRIGETTAKADGSWEFTPELTKQGEHKFTATAENKFGKSTPSNEATIDLDSIAPKLDNVKITPIDTNSKADDTAELTMGTGHTDTPNAEILFRDENNNIIGKGHANSAGDFLIQLDKAVQPGTPVVVQAIDKAGNAGTDMAIAGNIEHPNDTKGPKVDIDTVTPVDETNPSDGTPDKGIVKGKSEEPNAPVVVTDENGKTIGTGTTDDKGNFEITTTPIKPGDKVKVEVTDKAGHKGSDTETAGDTEILHKDLPEAPVITEVIDDVKGYGEDTKVGNVLDVKGHLTNDKTPTIKGTAKAGSKVEIYDNGDRIGETTAKADGSWEFTPELTKQGEHKFTATAENKFGKSTPSNEATIDLDSIAPKLDNVKITPIDTNSKADDTAELTMGTGHTDTPNAEILFRDENNNIIGKGHANSAGDFLIQLDKAVQPGTPVVVQAIDKAGNAGTDMAIAGNIEHPNDTKGPKVDIDTVTPVDETNPSDGTPDKGIVKGKSEEPNAPVVVTDENGKTIGTGTTDDKGNFEITTTPIKPGDKVKVEVTDKAGHKGSDTETAGDTEFVDNTPPSVEVKEVTPVDTNNPADGNPDKGIVKGKSDEPNAPVVVTDENGKTIGTGTTDDKGNFEITTDPIKPGDKVKVEVTDKAGNKGNGEGTAGNIEHPNDHTAPSEPTITFVEDLKPKDGKLNKDENSKDSDNANTTAKISIPTDAVVGDVIKYTVNGGAEESHTITNADKTAGHVEIKVPVADGQTSSVTAKIVDQAGNASKEVSGSIDVDLTIGNPKVRFLEDTDNNGVLSVAEVAAIKDGKAHWVIDIPTDGSIKAGDVIQSIDSKGNWVKFVTITDEMIKDGRFEATFNVDIEKLRNGKYETPEYRFADEAGNVSESSKASLTLDSEFSRQPSNPSITFPEDNDPKDGKISDKENKAGDNDAGKTTAEISIPKDGSVKPGDKLIVKDNSDKPKEHVITEKDIENGKVEVTVDIKTGDKTTITAEIVNPNNPNNPSEEISKDITEASSTVQVTIDEIYDDVAGGVVNGDVKNGLTNDNLPTFKGSAAPGATVEIYESFLTTTEKTLVGKTVADANGKWSFTPTEAMGDGLHYFEAHATDSAGNKSITPKVELDVDATAPSVENLKVSPLDISNPADNTPEKGRVEGSSDTQDAKVIVKDEAGNVIGEGKVGGDGKFVIDTTKALNPGDKVKVEITDEAGNTGKGSAVTGNDIIHTHATTQVTIDEIYDDVAGGVVNGDVKNGLTNDNLPTFKGSAAPGATVEIYESFLTTTEKTLVGKTVADANGKWSFTPTEAMGDGEHYFEAVATDKVGNKSTSDRVSLDVDTFTDAPVIDAVNDNVDSQTGNVLDAKTKVALTNDSTPTLEGYAEPNSVITIYEISELNGEKTSIGTVTADKHGGWKFELPELGDGEYKYTTRAQDKAGNISDFSEVVVVNADLIAPSEPTITFVEDVNPKDGKLNKAENSKDGDSTSTKAQISVPGDAEENDVIHYTINGEEKTHTITYNDRVTGYIEIKVPVVDGKASSVTAKIVDQAGNASKEVSSSIDSDFTAPNVKITGIIDNVEGGVYKGNVAGTNTNDNKPTIKGTADANQKVVLYDNNKEMGRVTADKDGNWEFKPSDYKEPLADLVGRVHVIKAVVTDAAGNTSEATSALEVDTTIGAPKVSIKEDADHNGVLSVDEAKNLKDSKIHWEVEIPKDGTVSAGDVLQVLGKDGKWKTEKVLSNDDLGKSFEYEAILSEKHFESPSYRIVDLVGNQSTAIHANVQLDSEFSRKPSNPEIKFPEDTNKDGKISDDENKANDNDAGKTTVEVTIPKDGSVKPGDKVVVTDDNGKKTEKPINQDDIDKGKIDIPVDLNPGKDNNVTAEIINPNNPNNPGKDSKVIGEDSENTKAPEAPVITEVIDNQRGGKFNEDVKGGLTNDSTPTFKGTAKPGTTITLKNGNDLIADNIPVKTNGSWEFTLKTPLAEGDYSITATAKNAAGKVSDPSDAATIKIDLHSDEPVITEIIDNVAGGVVNGDVKGGLTNDNTPTLKGTAEPFATVEIKIDGRGSYRFENGEVISNWTAVADKDGNWEFTTPKLSDGHHNFEAQATDVAGNNSQPSALVSIDVDTHIDAPVITAVTDNWWGGVENGGNILGVNDGFTNDTTPTFKGTAEAGSTIVLKNGNDIINKDIIVKADANGNWEFTPKSPLAEGEYNVVAIATDKAGNVSNPSNVATVNVDISTTQPVITEIIDDVAGGVVGNVKNALTNDNLPTLKGTAEAFSTVKIMVDDRLVFKDGKEVTVTADKDGNWEYTFEANLNWGGKVHAALEDGVHTLKVQTTDRAGNRSAVSEWSSVDVDKTIGIPKVKITTDTNGDKKIDIDDASALKDGKLKWVIEIPENTVKAGDRVQILGSDAKTWTDIFKVTAQDIAKGFIERDEFSIDMPKSRGFQTPSYRLVDDAGNVSEGSMDAVKIVGFAPKAPTIIAVLDNEYGIDPKDPISINAGDTTGNVLEGVIAITNDNTPTLMGKAEAGTTITLKKGNTVIADNIPVDANGSWHYEPEENSPWADGDYKITAIAKNIFGKESESSSPITVTVDTTGPEVTLTSIEDSVKNNDVVDFTGNVKDKFTNDNTPVLKGTAEAGSVIIIKYGEHHENEVTTKADKNGHWEYKITNPLSDGEHIISYQAVDKAGNTSLEYVANVTVDTKIADAKVEFIEDTNNDGKFSWKENIENPNIGRMAWKALIPNDGSIKAGDTFNYRWGASDSWHNRTITQADIDRGYIGEKVQNQYEQGQPNAGKPLAFGANANGRVYEAEAYFSDAAGNKGAKGSDKVVFDFSDNTDNKHIATTNVKITSIYDDVRGGHVGNLITNEAAQVAGLTNDKTPTISGTAEANASVKVSVVDSKSHSVWEKTITAESDGSWKVTTDNIADGNYSVTAVATNKAGAVSNPYTVSNLEIDTTIAQPNIWIKEDANQDKIYDKADYENPANGNGDITFVVDIPQDRVTIKAGDVFHYMINTNNPKWGNINGYTEDITITEADIKSGSISRVVTLCDDGKDFNMSHNGMIVSMNGYFKDLAGNALSNDTMVRFDLKNTYGGKVRSTRSLPDDILDNDSVDLSNATRINEPKAELNVLNNNKIGVSANDLLETPKDHIMNEGKSEAKPSYATASSHAGEENIATTHPIQIEEKVESHF
ncbi:retention module-containing protein [Campylobacter concisus]|uniref:retention module-containing protein n=1 Tax=Campylobacter concisus TaxID=199 RepID=UPI000CD98FBA|nr:retention module-containing protein [Campylobacter concisus]